MTKALLLASLLIAGTAYAAEPTTSTAQPKKSGMICREIGETGSRLDSKRVCMTKEQWEQARKDARDAVSQAQETHQTNLKGQ